jgi:hypothetical protein
VHRYVSFVATGEQEIEVGLYVCLYLCMFVCMHILHARLYARLLYESMFVCAKRGAGAASGGPCRAYGPG